MKKSVTNTKRIFTSFFLILFFSTNIFSQNRTFGIFKTSEDYSNKNLSMVLHCDSVRAKIKLHHFFCKNYIDVIQNENKFRFSKDSIFGYRDCNQNDFRFNHNSEKEYQILENKAIVIYSALVSVASTTGKTKTLELTYFFSITLKGEIFPLAILNLKKAFPDNLKFHDKLDVEFGDGTSISTYDIEHKMYKVNFLLNQSITN